MASIAAIGSPVAFPSLSRNASGNVLRERCLSSVFSSNRSSRCQNFSHESFKVSSSIKSDQQSDASLGSFVRNKTFSTLSSILLASTLISVNFLDSASAYEFDVSSDRSLMSVVDDGIDRDSYITMLQNLKTEQAPGASDKPLSVEERARLFKENLENKKKAAAKAEEERIKLEEARKVEAEAKAQKQAEEAAALKARSKPASPVQTKDVAKSDPSKSRGSMPLFLSQFSLLLAFAGVVSASLLTPESKIKELEQKKNEILEKVLPVVEEAVEKLKPVAKEALSTTGKLIDEAKPVVVKAIEQSKPVVAKAIEQAKPLLEKGQQKAVELLQQSKKSE